MEKRELLCAARYYSQVNKRSTQGAPGTTAERHLLCPARCYSQVQKSVTLMHPQVCHHEAVIPEQRFSFRRCARRQLHGSREAVQRASNCNLVRECIEGGELRRRWLLRPLSRRRRRNRVTTTRTLARGR